MKLRLLLFVFFAGLILAGTYYFLDAADSDPISAGPSFTAVSIPVQSYDLNDLGVVDINGDGYLDIYTTNHSALQTLLINSNGVFAEDALARAGLTQNSEFPGVDDQLIEVEPTAAGLYIYRKQRWLVLRAHQIDVSNPVRLTVEVPWELQVRAGKGAIEVLKSSMIGSMISIRLSGEERVELNGKFDIVELPHKVAIAGKFPLENVYVGSNQVSPASREFMLNWRDRHAMSWTDINHDGMIDVFISRGGVKGSIGSVNATINDEMFVQESDSIFSDRYNELGFDKSVCPGRQTTWVDINNDLLLDLHIVCGRTAEDVFRDQLWKRTPEGAFEEVGRDLGLDNATLSVGVWFDMDGDLDQDYLAYQKDKIVTYTNEHGTFSRSVVAEQQGDIRKFAMVDIDGDGDFDSYAVGRKESALLLNNQGKIEMADPAGWGLPTKGETATWVDYDNDGVLEVHVVPQGLLRRSDSGSFEETGDMNYEHALRRIIQGRCSWADVDNNGSVDSVCGFAYFPSRIIHHFETKVLGKQSSERWASGLYLNQLHDNGNHWIQVKLQGSSGNREAIGAVVRVHSAADVQSRLIGQFEGAHFSQGHYRVYFGLGKSDRVDMIEVLWPDGSKQVETNVEADRLLVIEKTR